MKNFSIKSVAILFIATVAMCFTTQQASAQCGGFGGSSFGVGFSSGFGGSSFNNGFGRSSFKSVKAVKPVYRSSGFNSFNRGFPTKSFKAVPVHGRSRFGY